jgi:hypothetical protein
VTVPIKSYLAYPVRGRRDELVDALRALSGCEAIPAINRDLVVVVTDTPDQMADDVLRDTLGRLEVLEGLALVAGLSDPDTESAPPRAAGP